MTLLDVRQTLRTARTAPPFFAAPGEAAPAKPVSVVVVEHEGAGVGIAVDEVKDVLYLRPQEWSALGTARSESGRSESGRSGAGLNEAGRGFFARAAIHQGRLLPLLDIGRLLSEGGLEVDQSA